jgi:hypothetical protein
MTRYNYNDSVQFIISFNVHNYMSSYYHTKFTGKEIGICSGSLSVHFKHLLRITHLIISVTQ